MADPSPPDNDDERDRRAANIFLVVCFVAVLATGYWLVDQLVRQRDIDNCVAQGRRNCGERIDVPAR